MAFLSTAWHHTRRSPYQAFAAVFIIMQTFFVVSVFSFLIFGSAQMIHYFESLPQITAFFTNQAKQENIQGLEDQLKTTGKISKMHFISKQDALSIYQRMFKNDPLLLEFVTADVLPASLEISTTNIGDLDSISRILKDSSLVKEVVYPQDIVANLTKWTNAIRKIGTALIAVLALDSIFLMIIIIGIKIAQKKEEVEIMRLLGATNWYIRWPFIIEGMLYGIVGAFFGWCFAALSLWYAMPFLSSFVGNAPIIPSSPLILLGELLGVEFLLSILLGALASFMAVFRYLR